MYLNYGASRRAHRNATTVLSFLLALTLIVVALGTPPAAQADGPIAGNLAANWGLENYDGPYGDYNGHPLQIASGWTPVPDQRPGSTLHVRRPVRGDLRGQRRHSPASGRQRLPESLAGPPVRGGHLSASPRDAGQSLHGQEYVAERRRLDHTRSNRQNGEANRHRSLRWHQSDRGLDRLGRGRTAATRASSTRERRSARKRTRSRCSSR